MMKTKKMFYLMTKYRSKLEKKWFV